MMPAERVQAGVYCARTGSRPTDLPTLARSSSIIQQYTPSLQERHQKACCGPRRMMRESCE